MWTLCAAASSKSILQTISNSVQYLMEDVDFSGVLPTNDKTVYTYFGASGGNPVSPIYMAKEGYRHFLNMSSR